LKYGLAWGIVTNKRMRFTDPLVELLALSPRTPCVVSGDTAAEPKPSPLPILHACRCSTARQTHAVRRRRPARHQAGNAAGCLTVAVSYGYLGTAAHWTPGAPI
jgi:phosphoglycolate phosphatase-like HAD superfamily hydrolase